MRSPRSDPGSVVETEGQAPRSPGPVAQGAGGPGRAAPGPIPQAVSAAENPMPVAPAEPPADAEGRRTLSAAVVRMGPDGILTVELRDGRALVLRDVVMGPKDYRAVRVPGGAHRGRYGDIAAARPGGGAAAAEPDLAASNPLGATRGSAERD